MTNPVPFAWAPSPARRIPLFDVASLPPAARAPSALPMRWPDKPAGALLDFSIDATALQMSTADALSMTVNAAGGCALAAAAIGGGIASLWLSGGLAGSDAVIDVSLSTVSGRAARRFIRMKVV